MSVPTLAVIHAAAGKSRRFGDPTLKKTFALLAGKPVWQHSVELFAVRDDLRQQIIVLSPEDVDWFRKEFEFEIQKFSIDVVAGGAERVNSVENALAVIRPEIDLVAIHDAARPCVSAEEIDWVVQKARSTGSAMLASPIVGTVKKVREGIIEATVPREFLWEAQTPQIFRRILLREAYEERDNDVPTDDAQLLEKRGYPVYIVPTERWNIKITTQKDLEIAEILFFHQKKKKSGSFKKL